MRWVEGGKRKKTQSHISSRALACQGVSPNNTVQCSSSLFFLPPPALQLGPVPTNHSHCHGSCSCLGFVQQHNPSPRALLVPQQRDNACSQPGGCLLWEDSCSCCKVQHSSCAPRRLLSEPHFPRGERQSCLLSGLQPQEVWI